MLNGLEQENTREFFQKWQTNFINWSMKSVNTSRIMLWWTISILRIKTKHWMRERDWRENVTSLWISFRTCTVATLRSWQWEILTRLTRDIWKLLKSNSKRLLSLQWELTILRNEYKNKDKDRFWVTPEAWAESVYISREYKPILQFINLSTNTFQTTLIFICFPCLGSLVTSFHFHFKM